MRKLSQSNFGFCCLLMQWVCCNLLVCMMQSVKKPKIKWKESIVFSEKRHKKEGQHFVELRIELLLRIWFKPYCTFYNKELFVCISTTLNRKLPLRIWEWCIGSWTFPIVHIIMRIAVMYRCECVQVVSIVCKTSSFVFLLVSRASLIILLQTSQRERKIEVVCARICSRIRDMNTKLILLWPLHK